MRPGCRTVVRALGLAACWVAACSSESTLVYPDLPEGQLVALLYVDQGAELVASSGLVSSTSPLEIEIDASTSGARRVLLAGFDRSTIAGLTELSAEALERATLELAAPGDPTLSEPRFWARADLGGDSVVLEAPLDGEAFPLRLTADWLPSCDRRLEAYQAPVVRLSCGSEYCDALAELRGCALRIDTNICGPSVLTAPVGPSLGELGEVVVERGTLSECRSAPLRPDALYSLDCGERGVGCLLDVFPSDLPINPAIRVRVGPPLLTVPALNTKPKQEEAYGYLFGLAHVGENLLVSSLDGLAGDARCSDASATRLFVLRDDTLEVVASATTSECLTNAVGDPVNGGFIAITGKPARDIVRIDLNGRIVDSVRLPVEIRDPLVASDGLFDAEPLTRGDRALAVFSFSPHRGNARSYVVAFDAETLEAVQVFTSQIDVPDRTQDYRSIFKGGRYQEYVVLDSRHEELWGFAIGTPEQPVYIPLSLCSQIGTPVEAALGQLSTALFRTFNRGQGSIGVYGLRDDSFCRLLASFEIAADPTSILGWQGSTVRHLVGLRRTTPVLEPRAYLGFFDSELPGFLPGLLEVGHGDIGPFVEGRSGVSFSTLPWTAQVLRIEATP